MVLRNSCFLILVVISTVTTLAMLSDGAFLSVDSSTPPNRWYLHPIETILCISNHLRILMLALCILEWLRIHDSGLPINVVGPRINNACLRILKVILHIQTTHVHTFGGPCPSS